MATASRSKSKSKSKSKYNAYAICTAMKEKHGWRHAKWKRCVKKVNKKRQKAKKRAICSCKL